MTGLVVAAEGENRFWYNFILGTTDMTRVCLNELHVDSYSLQHGYDPVPIVHSLVVSDSLAIGASLALCSISTCPSAYVFNSSFISCFFDISKMECSFNTSSEKAVLVSCAVSTASCS